MKRLKNDRRDKAVLSSVIGLTGGLNETSEYLQMLPGEMHNCVNYEELDSIYAGYRSIKGYERYDGQPAPSSVDISTYIDRGIDSRVSLLLAPELGITDASQYTKVISNTGVVLSSDRYFCSNTSYYFKDSSLSVSLSDLDSSTNFCFELNLNLVDAISTFSLLSKVGSFNLYIENGALWLSDNVSPTFIFDIPINTWVNLVIQYNGVILTAALDGAFSTNTLTATLVNTSSAVIIGDTICDFYACMLRASATIRYFNDFTPTTISFLSQDYYAEHVDDTARETARSLIGEVPGTGSITGGFFFDDLVYVFREDTTETKMYVSTPTGWDEIVQPSGHELELNGKIYTTEYRFESYNTNQPVVIIVDGVSEPRIFNGTTITIIPATNLPVSKFPAIVGAYDNRAFLGYAEGSVIFSNVGDPSSYEPLANAGELFLGSELTAIIESPGNSLALIMKDQLKILKSVAYSDPNWTFKVEAFSRVSGGYALTAGSFLGDVYFSTPTGVMALTTSANFGDFSANTLEHKVFKTYDTYKETIVGSYVDHNKSKYKIVFSSGRALLFSFQKDKSIKGSTKLKYDIKISGLFSNRDSQGDIQTFIHSPDSAYLYKLDSGTSFDGSVLRTVASLAYNTFSSATTWKRFRKLSIDVNASIGTSFEIKPLYSYGDRLLPKTLSINSTIKTAAAAKYGTGTYGTIVYGGAGSDTITLPLYISGYGTVLSTSIRTEEKFKDQHTLQSIIVDYSIGSRRI